MTPRDRSNDGLAASAFSSSPELRTRFWVYFTIVFVTMFSAVVTDLVGAPIWIALAIFGVVMAVIIVVEWRRLRRAIRETRGTSV